MDNGGFWRSTSKGSSFGWTRPIARPGPWKDSAPFSPRQKLQPSPWKRERDCSPRLLNTRSLWTKNRSRTLPQPPWHHLTFLKSREFFPGCCASKSIEVLWINQKAGQGARGSVVEENQHYWPRAGTFAV